MILMYVGCKGLLVLRSTVVVIRSGLSGGISVVKYLEINLA